MERKLIQIGRHARRTAACIAVALASVGLVGCGGDAISTQSVSGTVTINGKAIPDVEVYFSGQGVVAYGKTDAQGRYTLVQGAAEGENKVYFTKVEGGKTLATDEEGMDAYQMQMMAQAAGKKADLPRQVVPAEFADAANPKLSYMVPSGGTDSADFNL